MKTNYETNSRVLSIACLFVCCWVFLCGRSVHALIHVGLQEPFAWVIMDQTRMGLGTRVAWVLGDQTQAQDRAYKVFSITGFMGWVSGIKNPAIFGHHFGQP